MPKIPISEKSKSIVEYRLKNPCLTLQQVGDKFSLTRERIRQILVEKHSPTRKFIQKYLCLNCGNVNPRQNKKFCSRECCFEFHQVPVICDQCGKMFKRRVSNLLSYPTRHGSHNHTFCNRHCLGVWAGKHHKPLRKYDYNKVSEMYNSGTSYNVMCYELNASYESVTRIVCYLHKKGMLELR
jgi:hypothetical protein